LAKLGQAWSAADVREEEPGCLQNKILDVQPEEQHLRAVQLGQYTEANFECLGPQGSCLNIWGTEVSKLRHK
jgi:hypothetical protein